MSEQRLRDGGENATETRASDQEIVALFARLFGVKVKDLRRLRFTVDRADGASEEANIWRLQGGDILESDPGLGSKLIACKSFWGSNQVN